jgi:hypothetical protein
MMEVDTILGRNGLKATWGQLILFPKLSIVFVLSMQKSRYVSFPGIAFVANTGVLPQINDNAEFN